MKDVEAPGMQITVYLVEPEEEHSTEIDSRDRRALELATGSLGIQAASLSDVWHRYPETATLYVAWHSLKRSGCNVGSFQSFSQRAWRTHVVSGSGESGLTDPTTPEQ